MMEEKLVPELRFPEFEGKLETKRLGELADITKLAGYEYTKHIVYSKKGTIIGLRALNIKNNIITLDDVQYIDGSDFSKLSRSKLYIGDLLFTYIGANIGDIAIVPENDKYYLAPNISRIRCNETNAHHNFIFQYFRRSTFRLKEISKYVASSSQPALAMENIRKFKLFIPTLPEQLKIATFLTTVDQRIQLLSQKKEKLEEYKKGLMQKIFSQELRFGFDSAQPPSDGKVVERSRNYPDWEEKKLREVAEINGGGTPETVKSEYWNGNINWFTPTEIKQKYITKSNRKITELGLKKSSAKVLPENTLLFTSRATIGDVSIAMNKCTTNQGFQSFMPNDSYDTEFLYYWIRYNKKAFIRKSSGSTFIEISKSAIQKMKILLPSIQEQQKIASFLSVLDEQIERVAGQVDKLKEWKKGLLQKMFV